MTASDPNNGPPALPASLAGIALHHAGVAVLITAEQTDRVTIVYANPAFKRRFLGGADGSATNWVDTLRSPAAALALTEAFQMGRPSRLTVAVRMADDRPAWADVTTVPFEHDGVPHCVWTLSLLEGGPPQGSADGAQAAVAHDALTGLPARTLLRSRLRQARIEAERAGVPPCTALIHMGVDQFRSFNERVGREAGDEILIELGQRLTRAIRGSDTVARPEGDQFVLLVHPEGSEDGLDPILQRIANAVSAPFHVDGQRYSIAVTGGIACAPEDGHDEDTLLRNAERAFMQAKAEARGNMVRYTAHLGAVADARIRLETDLRAALAADALELHYQPKMEVSTGRMTGAEALARWQHPQHGLLRAGEFIPVAEAAGFSVELGRWALREACRQLAKWRAQDVPSTRIAVNIGFQHFEQPGFVDELRELLNQYGVPPNWLQLEITERAVAMDPARAIRTARAVRRLGVSLALDDFGTAYSSLAQLRNIPVDTLKLDRGFIQEIGHDIDAALLAAAAISTGHSLRLGLIAEGIETYQQLRFLARRRCGQVQGFLIAHPMAAEDYEWLLRQNRVLMDREQIWPRQNAQPVVVILDDEPNILHSLERALRREPYQVLLANNVDEALEHMNQNDVSVLITDHRMPGVSGIDFLGQVRELYPDTVRMILSGYTDLDTLTRAINQGAIFRFITKPWDDEELRSHIRAALAHHAAATEVALSE